MADRIDHPVRLATAPALVAIEACTKSTLAARLQQAAAEHDRAQQAWETLSHADDGRQVRDYRFKATRLYPAAPVPVDRFLHGEVIGQQAPGRSCTDQPAQDIEDFARTMAALWPRHFQRCRVGASKAPFFVADIRRAGLAVHMRTLAGLLLLRLNFKKSPKLTTYMATLSSHDFSFSVKAL